MQVAWLSLVGALLFGFPRVVHAQRFELDLSACRSPNPDEVRGLVELELRELPLPAAGSEPAARSLLQHLRVRCDAEFATLRIEETGEERELALAGVAAVARPRLLALSIAELLAHRPPPTVVQAPFDDERPPGLAPAPARPAGAPVWHLSFGAGMRVAPVLGVASALSLLAPLAGPLRAYGSFEFAQARTDVTGGRARLRFASLSAGPALARSGTHLGAFVGVGLRACQLFIRGEPDQAGVGRTLRRALVAPLAFAAAELILSPRAFLVLEADLAHSLREIRLDVQGGAVRTLSAWQSALRLSFGWSW